MSTVNRDEYPISTENEVIILSQTLSTFSKNTAWDDSCAVAQSMRANAPFNCITSFAHYNSAEYYEEIRKSVQKVAFWSSAWAPTYILTSYYQFKNTTQENMSFGDPTDYPASWANRRGSNLGSWWDNKFSEWGIHPDPTYYKLITGLNLQCVLGVICLGFRDGTYCSLAYYNAHKNDFSQPSCAFMRFLVSGDNNYTYERDIFPIDLEPRDFILFTAAADYTITAEHSSAEPFSDLYPAYMGAQYSRVFTPAAGSPYIDANNGGFPSLLAPLIGCACGGRMTTSEAFNPNTAQRTHAHFVFGGIYGTDYTLQEYNGNLYPVLTQTGLDQLLAMAATYGLPFSTDFPDTWDSLFSSDITTYIPVANEGGYYDGQFEVLSIDGVISEDLSDANAELWEGGVDAPYSDRAYDPSIPVAVDQIELTQPTLSAIGSFNTTFILNKTEVDAIQDYIYGADDTTLENFLKGISNFGGSPMDAFISLHMWPFDVRNFVGASTTANLVVGRTTIEDGNGVDVMGYIMPTDAKAVVDCGSFKILPEFKSFLDYEPYTTINLFIPFIGSVDLPPSLYMGKTVSVKLICDWITAATTAVIYADGIPLVYQQGVGAVSISMTGDNHSRTAGDVIGGLIGAGASAVGAVAAAYTGNVAGAAQMGSKALEMGAQTFNDYGKTDFTQAGSSSPMCGFYMPTSCYITISRPKLLLNAAGMAAYAQGVGYADSRVSTLAAEGSEGSGVVVCRPVKMSFSGATKPTPSEIEAIVQQLASGIYPS